MCQTPNTKVSAQELTPQTHQTLVQYPPMVSPVHFVQEVVAELKKVSWPTFEQTRNMTILVIVVTILMGVYIGGADFLFSRLMAAVLTR